MSYGFSGACVKLYDRVHGTPGGWYERCNPAFDWADLLGKVEWADLPWAVHVQSGGNRFDGFATLFATDLNHVHVQAVMSSA
jgi:hypothetical protein